MNSPDNGTAPASTEADPETITTSETDSSIADEGDPESAFVRFPYECRGFLRAAASGKSRPDTSNSGLEHRDHAAYMRMLDRKIRELGSSNFPFPAKPMTMMSGAA